MGETVLLKATCPNGHEWDVWGEDKDNSWKVQVDEIICPACDPPCMAIDLEEPENLS